MLLSYPILSFVGFVMLILGIRYGSPLACSVSIGIFVFEAMLYSL